jgi:hypothetical protein
MVVFRIFCLLGLHRWRGEADSIAKRYRHNTFWDKTNNRLDSPRALAQTCRCCGKRRVWSFRRGTWRSDHRHLFEQVDTSAAWRVEPVGEMAQKR